MCLVSESRAANPPRLPPPWLAGRGGPGSSHNHTPSKHQHQPPGRPRNCPSRGEVSQETTSRGTRVSRSSAAWGWGPKLIASAPIGAVRERWPARTYYTMTPEIIPHHCGGLRPWVLVYIHSGPYPTDIHTKWAVQRSCCSCWQSTTVLSLLSD